MQILVFLFFDLCPPRYGFRVHSEVCPACDIASQRMFRGGRTEFIRSPTNQTLKFILAFDDPEVSVRNTVLPLIILGFGCINSRGPV